METVGYARFRKIEKWANVSGYKFLKWFTIPNLDGILMHN